MGGTLNIWRPVVARCWPRRDSDPNARHAIREAIRMQRIYNADVQRTDFDRLYWSRRHEPLTRDVVRRKIWAIRARRALDRAEWATR